MKRETLLETENKREKTRILTFRNTRGDREIAQVVSCRFDDLSGVIAAVAGEIEKQHGGFWTCVEVQVYVPESEKGGEVGCGTGRSSGH